LADSNTAALVGSDSLLGREIRDIVGMNATGIQLRLIAEAEEEEGTLTRVGDEPAIAEMLNEESLDGARVIFLASPASARKALELAGDPPDAAIVDLTYVAEERPDARLRAPSIEDGYNVEENREAAVHVIAHPAAIAAAPSEGWPPGRYNELDGSSSWPNSQMCSHSGPAPWVRP